MNFISKAAWSAILILTLTPGASRAVDYGYLPDGVETTSASSTEHTQDVVSEESYVPVAPEPIDVPDERASRFEWKLKGAGWLVSNLESDGVYERESHGAIAGDLKLFWHATDSDLLGVTLEAGQGAGLDGCIPTFGVFLDEKQTDRAVRLTKAWYEHTSPDGWRARVGLIDLTLDRFDVNQFANAGYTQFSSSALVNNRAWDQPGSAPGASVWKELGERFAVGVGYQSVNKWDDVFSHGSAIVQAEYRTANEERQGTYRFYGWVNDAKTYDKTNSGWGFSLDQQIAPRVGLWARCGFQNEDVADIASHLSAGVELNHFAWSSLRHDASDDAFGIGVAVMNASSSYKTRVDASARDELWLESYYRYTLNDYAQLSPYIQYVRTPMGIRANGDVFALGLRCGVSL